MDKVPPWFWALTRFAIATRSYAEGLISFTFEGGFFETRIQPKDSVNVIVTINPDEGVYSLSFWDKALGDHSSSIQGVEEVWMPFILYWDFAQTLFEMEYIREEDGDLID